MVSSVQNCVAPQSIQITPGCCCHPVGCDEIKQFLAELVKLPNSSDSEIPNVRNLLVKENIQEYLEKVVKFHNPEISREELLASIKEALENPSEGEEAASKEVIGKTWELMTAACQGHEIQCFLQKGNNGQDVIHLMSGNMWPCICEGCPDPVRHLPIVPLEPAVSPTSNKSPNLIRSRA